MAILNSNQQPIIGWRSLVVTQVVNSVDADAQAFITAAGITNLGQASAINTLVNDLKTYGLWTKMKALYPMVGGTASSHKWNLKDPRDLDAAYRLVFAGGWTHSNTGAKPNGSTGYADTKLLPSVMAQNSVHVSVYSRTDIDGLYFDIYGENSTSGLGMLIKYSGRKYLYMNVLSSDNIIDNTTSAGFYIGTRTGSTASALFRNNTKIINGTRASLTPDSTQPLYLGAGNYSGTSSAYSPREQSFASIGDGLTDAEATAFYTAVQKYQTSLGRHVGTPILADGLTAGLLETYTGAAAAYSLRKLRTTYTGNAITVRRSSDNTSQDIGFDANGNLDTASLLSFVGAGNGFVSTWFDQSGNGRNLTQSTATNQLNIVNAGSLRTLNGKVGCYNAPLNTAFMECNFGSLITQPMTIYHIGSNNTDGCHIYDGYDASNRVTTFYDNPSSLYLFAGNQIYTSFTPNITTQRIVYALANSTSSKIAFNNLSGNSGNIGTKGLNGIKLGIRHDNTFPVIGYHQEFIIYNSNQDTNRTAISNNINSYYSIY